MASDCASLLALALILAPLSIAARLAFPIWDDASVWLLVREQGLDAIASAHADRPVMGELWRRLATSESAFWRAAWIAQALLWPALAWISYRLWRRFFPELSRYAWLAACMAVAPLATKVQMVTANVALASLLSVVLAYAALLLFLRFIAEGGTRGRIALVAGLFLLAAGILVQEYALSVFLVALVLCAAYPAAGGDGEARSRAGRAIGGAALTAAAAYVLYLAVADPGARSDVRPLYALTLGADYFLRLPLRALSVVWWGSGRGLAATLSDIDFTRRMGLLAAAYGSAVGGLLVYGSRPRIELSHRAARARRALIFAAALLAGLLPILVMGRVPWSPDDGMASRYGLPLLPLLSALTLLGALWIVRPRLRWVAVFAFGFAAGHAAFAESWEAVAERKLMAEVGALLAPRVARAEGFTVAAIALPERRLGPRRQWELTARIAANWPPDLRQRFWAFRFGGGPPLAYPEDARLVIGPRGACAPRPEIDRSIRMVVRRGPVGNVLWIEPRSDGTMAIEPYCLGSKPEPGGGGLSADFPAAVRKASR